MNSDYAPFFTNTDIFLAHSGMLLAVASGAAQLFVLIKLKEANRATVQCFIVLGIALFAIMSFDWRTPPAGTPSLLATQHAMRQSESYISDLEFAISFNLIGTSLILGVFWKPFGNKGKSKGLPEAALPDA
jgi:hypothetical protein